MSYPEAAWERAMKVQEVILKALSGELHWFRAADILGYSPRTLRRWTSRTGHCRHVRGRAPPTRSPPSGLADA
jgi:hypothetical protein